MTKLLAFVGATAGGYAGWALGAPAGPFAAFVVSVVGTAAGVYLGRRLGQHWGG
jgi:phage tail tape-measure protein